MGNNKSSIMMLQKIINEISDKIMNRKSQLDRCNCDFQQCSKCIKLRRTIYNLIKEHKEAVKNFIQIFKVEPLTSNIHSSECSNENMKRMYLDSSLLLNSYIKTLRNFQSRNIIYKTSTYRNKIKKKRIKFEKLIAKIYICMEILESRLKRGITSPEDDKLMDESVLYGPINVAS
ncbi:hypothetical protein ACR3K2_00520 [Cryptosporidium serpentis]